jgi:hypothetical protein
VIPSSKTASDDLVGALRGSAALRPVVDRGLAGGLRAWLDDGVFELLGVPGACTVRLSTRDVVGAPSSAGPTAMLRGALVAQLLRLHVAGVVTEDPFGAASLALAASGRDDDLVAVLDELDDDMRARLAAEIASHGAVLSDRLPAVPSRWSPRLGVRQQVRIAGGGVVLRGLVDLSLGEPGGATACVCLVDVTTSLLEERHALALAYLALLETLRTGEPPLRVAALSTADGGSLVCDVDAALLAGGVDAVLRAIGARDTR